MEKIIKILFSPFFPEADAVRLIYAVVKHGKKSSIGRRVMARYYQLLLLRRYAIHVHPSATVGRNLKLPHPVGIVIGSGSVIGENVTLYQHVTVGRASRFSEEYPTVCNDVVLYPSSVVAGPINIGRGSIIGANNVVTKSVPEGSIVPHP